MNIRNLASVIRTKNAGPYIITADILFPDERTYLHVKRSNIITRELMAQLCRLELADVLDVIFFDPARCIKINFRRPAGQASGDLDDPDVLGMQQHAPLLAIEIPDEMLQ